MISTMKITLRLTLIMTPCWLIMGKALKRGKNRYDGSTDAASVRLHFQIRYRATAIDPLRYLPPQE